MFAPWEKVLFVKHVAVAKLSLITNGLFTFIFSNADGILLFSNDDVLHNLLARPGSHGKSTLSVSMKEMNQHIATSLAGIILPLENKPKKTATSKTEERKNNPTGKFGTTRSQEIVLNVSGLRGVSSNMDHIMRTQDFRKKLTLSATDSTTEYYSSLLSDNSLSVMSRQPKRSTSALLRYRGVVAQKYETPAGMADSHYLSGPCGEAVRGNELWDMLTTVCPEPSKKFATVHHVSKPKVSWDSLGQSLVHSIQRCDKNGVMFSTLGAILVARGDNHLTFPQSANKIEERLKSSLRCIRWNPSPLDFWISKLFNINNLNCKLTQSSMLHFSHRIRLYFKGICQQIF